MAQPSPQLLLAASKLQQRLWPRRPVSADICSCEPSRALSLAVAKRSGQRLGSSQHADAFVGREVSQAGTSLLCRQPHLAPSPQLATFIKLSEWEPLLSGQPLVLDEITRGSGCFPSLWLQTKNWEQQHAQCAEGGTGALGPQRSSWASRG